MSSFLDELIKYARYRWEFLRRNPEYIKDWEALKNELNKHKNNDMPNGDLQEEEIEFCEKWKIGGGALPPSKSFEEMVSSALPKKGKVSDLRKRLDPDLTLSLISPQLYANLPVKKIEGDFKTKAFLDEPDGLITRFFPGNKMKRGKIKVEIDLNYSKNRIKKEINGLIEHWQMLYEINY